MDDDTKLLDLFDRAVDQLATPTETMVARGLQRGRRLRRRRRIVQAGSGVCLVGLMAALTVTLLPPGAATGPTSRPSAVPATGGFGHNRPATVRDERESISPQLLATRAIDLLPRHGTITHLTGRGMQGTVLAEFVYDDGNGAAQIDVAIGFTQDGVDGVSDVCRPNDPNSTETCQIGPDGSHLATFKGREYSYSHDPNATEYAAHLARADGVEIDISEWNAPQEKDADVTRALPPFTVPELVAFVRDASWTPWVMPSDNAAVADRFTPDYVYDGNGTSLQSLEARRAKAVAQTIADRDRARAAARAAAARAAARAAAKVRKHAH